MNDIFNREITIYDSVKDRTGHNGTLAAFLQMGIERRGEVDKVRAAADEVERAEGEEAIKAAEDRLRAAKQVLPCCTISGTFTGGHKAENLTKHSGLICIDIDHCDPSAVMKQLEEWDIIAFASRSASGRGVFAVVPLAFPDRHREQFFALERLFKDMGITIDQATKDVSRLRFLSYDPEAWHRPNAVEFTGIWRAPDRKPKQERQERHTSPTSTKPREEITDYDRERAAACVREIQRRHIDIAPDNETWHNIAFSLSTLGESGRDLFRIIAEQCTDPKSKATPSENDREFSRGLKENKSIGLGTFFAACDKWGINGKDVLQNEEAAEMFAEIERQEQEDRHAKSMTMEERRKAFPNAM